MTVFLRECKCTVVSSVHIFTAQSDTMRTTATRCGRVVNIYIPHCVSRIKQTPTIIITFLHYAICNTNNNNISQRKKEIISVQRIKPLHRCCLPVQLSFQHTVCSYEDSATRIHPLSWQSHLIGVSCALHAHISCIFFVQARGGYLAHVLGTPVLHRLHAHLVALRHQLQR